MQQINYFFSHSLSLNVYKKSLRLALNSLKAWFALYEWCYLRSSPNTNSTDEIQFPQITVYTNSSCSSCHTVIRGNDEQFKYHVIGATATTKIPQKKSTTFRLKLNGTKIKSYNDNWRHFFLYVCVMLIFGMGGVIKTLLWCEAKHRKRCWLYPDKSADVTAPNIILFNFIVPLNGTTTKFRLNRIEWLLGGFLSLALVVHFTFESQLSELYCCDTEDGI